MTDLIKLYNGEVTKGKTDGNEVSASNPVSFTLNAAKNEEACQLVALRCKEGYKTFGDVTVTAYHLNHDTNTYESTGGDVAKWFFAPDKDYKTPDDALKNATWANSLTISDVIDATNTIFWVKAGSNSAEVPQNDTDESVHVEATIEAV